MKTVILILLFTISAFAKPPCYVVEENGTGKPVKICSSQRPVGIKVLGKIDRSIEYFKPLIPLVAEAECEDCSPQECIDQDLEVLRGDRDSDGINEAWCVGPTKYVFDAAKKAHADAEKLAAENASKTKGEQKAAAIRRIQSGCKSATGLMKDICTVVGGG